MKELESERRDEALSRPIDCNNVGFKLLEKMGFKAPNPIDKDQSGSTQLSKAVSEPIAIQIKVNRTCLGYDTEKKHRLSEQRIRSNERHEGIERTKRIKVEKIENEFHSQNRLRFHFKQVQRDLYLAQKACCSIEQQKGLTVPSHDFYWPRAALPTISPPDTIAGETDKEAVTQEAECNEYEPEEQLTAAQQFELLQSRFDRLNDHLRTIHSYCVWCGCCYETDVELNRQCPGSSRELHDL